MQFNLNKKILEMGSDQDGNCKKMSINSCGTLLNLSDVVLMAIKDKHSHKVAF